MSFKFPHNLLGAAVLRVIPKEQIALSICFLRPELHTMGEALALKDLIHGTQPSAPTSFTWLGLQRADCSLQSAAASGSRCPGQGPFLQPQSPLFPLQSALSFVLSKQ